MSRLTTIFAAIQAGKELKNPASWKQGQMLTNLVGAVVAGVIVIVKWQFPDAPLPEGVEEYFAEIIGTILVVVNLYLTTATTTKIGVKQK
jgi:hypothetical protein